MIKRLSLFLSLFLPVCLLAETVPALVIGGETKVPLSDIVSVKADADSLYVLKSDGSTFSQVLAALTFGTTESGEGIRERLAEEGLSAYIVYDLDGRFRKQGRASQAQEVLAGLQPGIYIVQMGDQRFKVQTDGTTGNVPFRNPEVSKRWTVVPSLATAADDDANNDADNAADSDDADNDQDDEYVPEPAMQIELPGIDAMITLARLDSLMFSADLTSLVVIRDTVSTSLALSDIAQISFPMSLECVTLAYSGSSVEGVNPFYFDGVSISLDGAGVTVNSTYVADEVEFELSGASSNGYFKYYGDKKFKTTLMGLTLSNPNGPVINSQSGKKGTIKSQNGYVNTLSDGSEYATSTEDQKGCIFSEGQLIFSGKGTLNILSNYKHAIASDDYVSFENGTVNVLSSVGDAVHAKDSILVQSGTISLICSGDGLDSDGPITIREGENGIPVLSISSDGDGAKGIKTAMDFLMTNGIVDITLTGQKKVADGKTTNVVGVKADGNIVITGGTLTIVNTCPGGKYLSADGTITISPAAKVIY